MRNFFMYSYVRKYHITFVSFLFTIRILLPWWRMLLRNSTSEYYLLCELLSLNGCVTDTMYSYTWPPAMVLL